MISGWMVRYVGGPTLLLVPLFTITVYYYQES
jgi:hypothetical protein